MIYDLYHPARGDRGNITVTGTSPAKAAEKFFRSNSDVTDVWVCARGGHATGRCYARRGTPANPRAQLIQRLPDA